MSRDDADRALRHTEPAGEKFYELFVGGAIHGRCMQPHFQCRTVNAGQFRARGTRLNVDSKPHTAFDCRYRKAAHRSRSTAPCRNPMRKYAMIGVMSIGPIAGITCRKGRSIGSLTA